jgi:hypothetical protein
MNTPAPDTASSTAPSATTPSHFQRRYCHGATGLVIVCQIVLSR